MLKSDFSGKKIAKNPEKVILSPVLEEKM